MSKFQTGLLVVFGAFIVIAVILFSQNRGGGGGNANLTVWGSLSANDFSLILNSSGLARNQSLSFNYTEKSPDRLSSDFTEALAEGQGPDLIILPLDNLLRDRNKLMLIPAETVRSADFVNTFIKEGELFQTGQGAYALPMYVDPMVMYWNRDMLTQAALANPMMYWDQIYTYIGKLLQRDGAGNIVTTAMALGEYRNIPHAKEILSLLMLQAGTPIVTSSGTTLRSALLENPNGSAQIPGVAAVEFFTQFANPEKSYYSWNRSQVTADTHFTSGKSAMYLGFASELPILKAKNPTMDIGIAQVPQSRVSGRVATYGKLYGVAVVRTARDPAGALSGALALVSKDVSSAIGSVTSYVPVRRDLLSNPPTDPAGFTFYGAALQSSGWLDPEPVKTEIIFRDLIESVTSGRARVETAIGAASEALNALIEQS